MANSPAATELWADAWACDALAQNDTSAVLGRMTGEIQHRMAEVESRHADAMRDMQTRLEHLATVAQRSRPSMSPEMARAFERIEAGMAHLVDRVADSAPREQASERFVFAEPKSVHHTFVFDAPAKPLPPAPTEAQLTGEHWDSEAITALADLYESGQAAVARSLPDATPPALARPMSASILALRAAVSDIVDPSPSRFQAPAASPQPAPDQDWLARQFDALSRHVSSVVSDARPDAAFTSLMARVDELEARFASALDTSADGHAGQVALAESVAGVERQISAITDQVEHAQRQLSRLESIESQLGELMAFARASVAEESGAADEAAHADHEAHEAALIERTAERVAQHLQTHQIVTAPVPATNEPDRLQAMLEKLLAEHRANDRRNSETLDTVQEALVRLIDRFEQFPSAQAAHAAHEHDAAAHLPERAQNDQIVSPPLQSRPLGDAHAERPMAPAPRLAEAPAAAAAEQPSARPRRRISIDDLRHEMAKAESAAVPGDATMEAPPSVADAAPAGTAAPRRRTPRATQDTGGSSRRGILIAAAALSLVGVSYVASLLFEDKFSSRTPALPAPSPAGRAPATSTPVEPKAPTTSPAAPRPSVAPEGTMPPGASATPAPQAPVAPHPADQKSSNLDFTPTKPQSIPETVTNGVDQTEVPDNNGFPARSDAGQVTGKAATAVAAMPGLAVEGVKPSGRVAATDARQASVTTGAIVARAAAVPATRIVREATTSGSGEAVASASEMPPAQIGPNSLRQAAMHGDAFAQFEVATRFAEGRGVKKDFAQARVWYERAAVKGLAIAQYRLGTLNERGLGTAADLTQARTWYERAADQGNVKAMHNLAVISVGNGGDAADYQGALRWFKSAAAYGLTDSQFNLAVLYESGLGVAKDLGQAYFWYNLAARNGDAEAARRRDRLIQQLDTATVQNVDGQIAQWRPKSSDPKINDARVAGDLWRRNAA